MLPSRAFLLSKSPAICMYVCMYVCMYKPHFCSGEKCVVTHTAWNPTAERLAVAYQYCMPDNQSIEERMGLIIVIPSLPDCELGGTDDNSSHVAIYQTTLAKHTIQIAYRYVAVYSMA